MYDIYIYMSDQSWCCRCKKVTPDSTKIEYVRTKNDKLRKICNCECGTKKSTFVNQRTGGALTDDEKTEANYWSRIAASAYENPEDRAKYISEAGINDLEIDPEDEGFQDERTAVYKNKETGKRIYGMRGTNFKDKKDLKADAWIVAGDVTKSGVYKHWDKQLGGLIDKYGKENVERLVGHSLAGRTALELGKKYDIASESFNTGSAPSDVTKKFSATKLDTIEDICRESDFVSINCPATKETLHLMNEERFKLMKKTAFVINTARGDIIDEKALVQALVNKEIAGAGLDVFETEPNLPNELKTMENVVSFPHLGSATIETRLAMGNTAIDNTLAFFAGTDLPNKVV